VSTSDRDLIAVSGILCVLHLQSIPVFPFLKGDKDAKNQTVSTSDRDFIAVSGILCVLHLQSFSVFPFLREDSDAKNQAVSTFDPVHSLLVCHHGCGHVRQQPGVQRDGKQISDPKAGIQLVPAF
ncbi:hypothetical protein, partial [Anaerotruncus sp. G3(2012)]|uniref:hypothetical protein n=1 Tax=Anaerotruncus sp. G3(2012) TaxID=1235835 RepID=UPI001A995EAB